MVWRSDFSWTNIGLGSSATLVGRDWTVGFNLSDPTNETENKVEIFKAEFEITKPHLTGEHAFLRDMTMLRVTANGGGWTTQIS